jgi:hypothetical protein
MRVLKKERNMEEEDKKTIKEKALVGTGES